MAGNNYEGTKITDVTTLPNLTTLDTARVLIVTDDNQYTVPMSEFVDYLKDKINNP